MGFCLKTPAFMVFFFVRFGVLPLRDRYESYDPFERMELRELIRTIPFFMGLLYVVKLGVPALLLV